MTDDRRQQLAAITAGCDQSDAEYRDWLQSQTMEQLDDMIDATRWLRSVCDEARPSSRTYAMLGVVTAASRAIRCELLRRAEVEAGGGA